MSQTYEPNNPEQEQGHLAGPGFAGGAGYPVGYSWAGYGSEPPPPFIRGRTASARPFSE